MSITLADIVRINAERGYSVAELSEYSGVPVGTLQKILNGDRVDAVETFFPALENVLLGADHAEKRQGEYTLEDYFRLPEDRRAELIDGVIYDMAAPTPLHQMIAGTVYAEILAFIKKNEGNCLPFIAPADVQLDCDSRTMVQPDVFVLCKQEKLKRFGIYGAPDFVLEILSDSTRKKDMTVKLTKYMEAGVKEYWVIDPDKRLLIVYIGEEEGIPRLYPLQGDIGMNLFDGRLRIDLDEINDLINRFGSLEE